MPKSRVIGGAHVWFWEGEGKSGGQKFKVILNYLVSSRVLCIPGDPQWRESWVIWNLVSHSAQFLGKHGNNIVLTRLSYYKQPANNACNTEVNSRWCVKQYCLQASLMAVWFSFGFLRKAGYFSAFFIYLNSCQKWEKEYILTDFVIFPLTHV